MATIKLTELYNYAKRESVVMQPNEMTDRAKWHRRGVSNL